MLKGRCLPMREPPKLADAAIAVALHAHYSISIRR
jgi:hypothetical protein